MSRTLHVLDDNVNTRYAERLPRIRTKWPFLSEDKARYGILNAVTAPA
jgi:hypothetical protein